MTLDLHLGDSLEILKTLPANSIDSIVTDPPAGIAFMGKAWDHDRGGRDQWIAWMQSIAAEGLRVLKPGGHAVVWALPRTSHWTATAWENAGFECRDILHHAFGSGFPKSLNVSLAIDREAGATRKVTGTRNQRFGLTQATGWNETSTPRNSEIDETEPASDAAKTWDGFGTSLKPAIENWLLLRKPLEHGLTVAANVQKWGTGALNIDACRVTHQTVNGGNLADNPHLRKSIKNGATINPSSYDTKEGVLKAHASGRYPANLVLTPDEEVLYHFPKSEVGNSRKLTGEKDANGKGMFGSNGSRPTTAYDDKGTAARFYKQVERDAEDDCASPRQQDSVCALCNSSYVQISGKIIECNQERSDHPVASAVNQSSKCQTNTAQTDALDLQRLGQEGNWATKSSLAPNAANNLNSSPEIIPSIAALNAASMRDEQLVHNVRYAGNLCVTCGTSIAQSLVAMQHGLSQDIHLGMGSMPDHKRQILIQSLALYVAGRENTDTILTIPSLRMLFGYVQHAIIDTIPLAKAPNEAADTEFAARRLLYQSKPSRAERELGLADAESGTVDDGRKKSIDNPYQRGETLRRNTHATVKAIALMRYLCRLVTPPNGVVLDAFMGSGSTGVAALREGFSFIGIELEDKYMEIAKKRIAAA